MSWSNPARIKCFCPILPHVKKSNLPCISKWGLTISKLKLLRLLHQNVTTMLLPHMVGVLFNLHYKRIR